MERSHLESVSAQEGADLAPRERVLVELLPARGGVGATTSEIGSEQPARAVPVGHRDEERSPRLQYPSRLAHDRTGTLRIVLDHPERQIARHRSVPDAEGTEVHHCHRSACSHALTHSFEAPVRPDSAVAALPQEHDVLAEAAASLQEAAASVQMAL